MVIWKDVPVKIRIKMPHIRKIGGRVYDSFINDYGDIPVVNFNTITNKFEEVVNNRGTAYAARNRLRYRNKRI